MLSLNLRNAVSGDYPDFRINYLLVQMGMGMLMNPERVSAESQLTGMIQFNWPDNSGTGSARATDRAFVAVYCEELHKWITRREASPRMTGSYILDMTAFSGKAVHAYIGFLSADSQFVSTRLYTGLVNIL